LYPENSIIMTDSISLAQQFDIIVKEWLLEKGLTEANANLMKEVVEVTIIFMTATIAYFIAKWILIAIFHHISKKTTTKWDDILFQKKFFNRLSYLVPAYICSGSPFSFSIPC